MANRGRRRQEEGETEALTKEEDAVARYLRFSCPTKVGNCNGNDFPYFVGSKAVETLLESKKFGINAKEPQFKTKGDVEVFMRTLINKGAVFRAKKVVLKKKTPEEKRRAKKDDKASATSSPKTKREKEIMKQEEEKKEESDSGTDAKKDDDSDEKKEKKKKVILVMQQTQYFSADSSDVYAWVFDPTPWHKKLIGALMLIAVVLGCLFPLWPDWLRLGVYYLSMGGIIFLLSIMGLAIARTILFGIIYGLTMGKHHLWILPNLTADCGFLESFQPFYTYEFVSGDDKKGDKKKLKSSPKDDETNESKAPEKAEKTPETSKTPSSNEEEPENDEEEDEEHQSESSAETASAHQPAFENVPAEEFTPEPSNRRRRRPRREDESDFVMINK